MTARAVRSVGHATSSSARMCTQMRDVVVALGEVGGGDSPGQREQRIAVEVGGDLPRCGNCTRHRCRRGRGSAPSAGAAAPGAASPRTVPPPRGRRRDRLRVVAVRGEVADAGTLRRLGYPALGVGTEMPKPLSSQTSSERQRQALDDAVAGGVQRAGRGGMVQAGVAEADDGDARRRATGSTRRAWLARPIANATPTRARQVRGDRGRLRDDRERRVAEDLVAAAGCGVGDRGHHAEQDRRTPSSSVRPACSERAGRRRRSGSAAARGRYGAARRRRARSTRARPSRSCRSPGRARASGVPGCRVAGCRPSRRTGPSGRRRARRVCRRLRRFQRSRHCRSRRCCRRPARFRRVRRVRRLRRRRWRPASPGRGRRDRRAGNSRHRSCLEAARARTSARIACVTDGRARIPYRHRSHRNSLPAEETPRGEQGAQPTADTYATPRKRARTRSRSILSASRGWPAGR